MLKRNNGCTYNEYTVDFGGTLSEVLYNKYMIGAEQYIDEYGLNTDIKSNRFALYEIIDYLDSNRVSGTYKSESADGYSYTRFDITSTLFSSGIADCVKRWVHCHSIEWV